MSFGAQVQHLIETGVGAGLKAFATELDVRWVEAALERCGPAKVRRRKLPMLSVVWLVIGMALHRDLSIDQVVEHLDLVLPEANGDKGKVADSALPKARYRLGEGPLAELFACSASHWAHEHAAEDRWRGLSIYALDGTTLSVQDTDENREAFGLPKSGRAQSGYPKVRLVTLMAARSHLIVDAAIGPFHGKGTAEPMLARPMWDGVPDESLLIVDRNFIDYGLFHHFSTVGAGRHWLVRMKKNLVYESVQVLGDGDELAEVEIGRHQRRDDPQLPRTMPVRIIHYELDGGPQRLMTSLLDAKRWPADEIIEMYHERWEVEIAFDELKTHMLERKETLRSKAPVGVRQEIWGILLAYNLIRYRMAVAARQLEIEPRMMSFVYSLRMIRAFLLATAWVRSVANIPSHLERLDQGLESATLPARRTHRRYKRWVKVKMSGYARNPGRPPKPPDPNSKLLK
jgi:hypothetical protein